MLVMIEAHVLDGWTRVADRGRTGFGYAMILGGFGAPLFLFLAGISLVLSAASKERKTGDADLAWRAVQKRGWQIFGLAFLFRLQSFILTGGYSPIGLLKVDILNVMGPAIVVAALLGQRVRTRSTRAMVFAAATVAIAMLTPIVRNTSALNLLPDPVEWYFRASPTRTNFTLFPWAGFVFAGALVGMLVERLQQARQVPWKQVALAAVSLVVVAASYEAAKLPSIYERSDFWTSSPTFFFLRAGVIALLLPLAYFWDRAPWRGIVTRWSILEELGRSSLFVYWIHVEMVYGFISWPLRRALSFEAAIVADVLFSLFLLGLVLLKNRLTALPKPSRVDAPEPTPAPIYLRTNSL